MIFIERYSLKRCQGCVKLIASISKVNCFLNITDLSEVQLCMSSNSWTWECPHTKDGADHVPLFFLSSVLPHMIRSYYCCCCINKPVIFSHCVHLKLWHRFHALFESLLWSWRYVPLRVIVIFKYISTRVVAREDWVAVVCEPIDQILEGAYVPRPALPCQLQWHHLSIVQFPLLLCLTYILHCFLYKCRFWYQCPTVSTRSSNFSKFVQCAILFLQRKYMHWKACTIAFSRSSTGFDRRSETSPHTFELSSALTESTCSFDCACPFTLCSRTRTHGDVFQAVRPKGSLLYFWQNVQNMPSLFTYISHGRVLVHSVLNFVASFWVFFDGITFGWLHFPSWCTCCLLRLRQNLCFLKLWLLFSFIIWAKILINLFLWHGF